MSQKQFFKKLLRAVALVILTFHSALGLAVFFTQPSSENLLLTLSAIVSFIVFFETFV